MGLFDFVKGIGKKNTAPAEQQLAAPAAPAEPSAQEMANKLLGHIKSLGLPIVNGILKLTPFTLQMAK